MVPSRRLTSHGDGTSQGCCGDKPAGFVAVTWGSDGKITNECPLSLHVRVWGVAQTVMGSVGQLESQDLLDSVSLWGLHLCVRHCLQQSSEGAHAEELLFLTKSRRACCLPKELLHIRLKAGFQQRVLGCTDGCKEDRSRSRLAVAHAELAFFWRKSSSKTCRVPQA